MSGCGRCWFGLPLRLLVETAYRPGFTRALLSRTRNQCTELRFLFNLQGRLRVGLYFAELMWFSRSMSQERY